ncbi:Allantoinase, mitochondrial [Lamellibrachia satsuma]|nr:Allantoinase, mitochondrial [Lamellibrachia satsuma]
MAQRFLRRIFQRPRTVGRVGLCREEPCDLVIMPGVVDSHVHLNEPGRTEWEGFLTATRAAAAGGITTVVDMPLNSIPSTTSVEAFRKKMDHARGQCFVDVGFWGGVVPGNRGELPESTSLASWKENDIRAALEELQGTDRVLMFHAEVETEDAVELGTDCDPCLYDTFVKSRPDSMEVKAIETVCRLCKEYGVRCHVVHLSSADAIEAIKRAKADGAPLSVETTHHYLTLAAEDVPRGATQYKCCPPIRSKLNQERLWAALKAGGHRHGAWGGIASLQFGLALFWTRAEKIELTLGDVARLLCENTAALCSMGHRKGAIKVGYDADFVIWDPNSSFKVESNIIQHKNKVTPYADQTLRGVVRRTVVAGETVFENGVISAEPKGHFVFPRQV